MLQIDNHTPFQAELHPAMDIHGRDFLVVIIKASYILSPLSKSLKLADQQVAVQHADDYYAEPGQSSIKLPSDLALAKPATDVIVVGHAYAPGGRAVSQCEVRLTIGDSRHSLRVFGDRVWQKHAARWSMSPAAGFERMPLRYENAYGGIDQSADKQAGPFACETFNPCGKGFFAIKGRPFEGLALPNIEDPRALISDIDDRPRPAGFGAIARDWQPRLTLAGTYDAPWQKNRMPLLPMDFDPSFFNAAHPSLRFAPHLLGTEPVSMTHVNETGALAFNLPGEKLTVTARIRGQDKTFITTLDALVIQPDEQRVTLTWRSAIACAGKMLYVDSVDIKRARAL